MRVAIVTESFLPRVNGVTGSVCRVVEHLVARGDEALVVAPAPGPASYAGQPVRLVAGLALPTYPSFSLGLPTAHVEQTLREYRPDVVHLASPVLLGASGAAAARRLAVPSVAVFQTDLAGFARRHRLGLTEPVLWQWLRRVHSCADRTLAPSTATLEQLRAHGFPRLARWGRGVDTELFAPARRSAALRRSLAPGGETLVGYVGRLAREKRLHLLRELADLPGVRLVLVGEGPEQPGLRALLPHAAFLGLRTGTELATAVASLDVFVHPGRDETFCQAAQEALACGVPVVAPASGGLLDLVQTGRTGLLVDPDRPGALRDGVAALLEQPGLAAWMGRQARLSVQGRTWAVVGDELLGHYRAVTAGGEARITGLQQEAARQPNYS